MVGCTGVAVGPVPLETQSLKLELMFPADKMQTFGTETEDVYLNFSESQNGELSILLFLSNERKIRQSVRRSCPPAG